MYLNIGKSDFIRTDEIIAVFDLDITSQSHITRSFLKASEKTGKVISVSDDIPKSYIIISGADGKEHVYLSQLSSATLIKRLENNSI